MKKQILSFLFLLTILLVGLSGFAAARKPKNISSSNTEASSRLSSAQTKFGCKLFSQLVDRTPDSNIFISPASIAFALAMTYNGAAGETREAMARTLELGNMSLDDINRANAALRASLQQLDPQVQLNLANSLWARQGIEFKSEFLKRNQVAYGAELEVVDFSNPQALARINAWVSQNTQGKIEKIVDRIDPLDILFLINALYFKGQWTEPFDQARTQKRIFTRADGRQLEHPMMSQGGVYKYYRGPKFQAVSLPYGQGRVSMDIFLPDRDSNLQEFFRHLNAETWQHWFSEFKMTPGDIVLPRFKLEYAAELKEPLKTLGMAVAFDPNQGNFEHMVKQKAYISKVKHKTFIEVNEEGTEAAAATSVGVTITAAPAQSRFNMVVDRPFFLSIRDQHTGTILFMGAIVEPE
ncbi:MAG: serpin family protein [Desulfobacteraceae bacterium]